ncbi:ABC transporter ATP-binding protein [Pseudoduganella ginsengisoli]|uniref:ATP-binding cassette domain-containing protein n=1 Tax=Pseudoduganella ginsengisoli TaxID=1462440 RepID=A0A6L6Q6W8_9BURK|nr:ABC transporter ATP-binding protein [Pseudoduganella ginsengisoli]MTW05189.1 ATP-binding cassette domain-containing protein [Pseudoduganella ginsengisoli]
MKHSTVELGAPTLHMENVGFRYRNGHQAVQGFTLTQRAGILGVLGPNGAGKSTLMRMLATLTRPTEGAIVWNGADCVREPDALRRSLGYLPQEFGTYPALTAREFLHYLAAVKGLPHAATAQRVQHCLELVGLEGAADKRLADCSGGMRQRVGIAQALLNDPQLLIVDEPTVGLDPDERQRFRNLLTDLAGQRLVLLSTHIVSDLEASATALAVMEQGRLLFHDTPQALLSQAVGKVWQWTIPATDLSAVRTAHRVSASLLRPGGVQVRIVAATAPSPDAVAAEPTLEDAYVWLLSRQGGRG